MNHLSDFQSVFFRDKIRRKNRIFICIDFGSRSCSRVGIRSDRFVIYDVSVEDPATSEKSLHSIYGYKILIHDSNIFIWVIREFDLRIRGKRSDRSISNGFFVIVEDKIDRIFSDNIFDS